MSVVRKATSDDAEAILETVLAAFVGEPAWDFMVGDDPAAREAFARALLIPRLARGTVWMTDGAAGVALWERRDGSDAADPLEDEAWRRFRAEVGSAVWHQLEAYEEALGRHAPSPPHWYLGVLATRPDAQGQGHATALLEVGFSVADADGWDCWLETSTPENKAFYERRGFSEARPVSAPGLPPTWWLGRPHAPRPA